jgi:hypothetical protein
MTKYTSYNQPPGILSFDSIVNTQNLSKENSIHKDLINNNYQNSSNFSYCTLNHNQETFLDFFIKYFCKI